MTTITSTPAAPAATRTVTVLRAARRGARRRLAVLVVLAVAMTAGFCVIGLTGNWEYALGIRYRKIAAMVVVGVAIACSSVLFQTITGNRILTPGIMGFDQLFVLIQTVVVYLFGALALSSADPLLLFVGQMAVMVAFAGLLYRALFGRGGRDIYVMVLAGVVFGTLFGSLSSLAARLINPNDFVVLQDSLFASFNSVDVRLLWFAAALVAVMTAWTVRLGHRLDVVALGRDTALNLGVNHVAVVRQSLIIVAVLVSAATALVGPITFLGLLVANLARQLTGTFRHGTVLPAAMALSVIVLVGGQLVLERVFGMDTALSIIINFVGGVYFIALLLREGRR